MGVVSGDGLVVESNREVSIGAVRGLEMTSFVQATVKKQELTVEVNICSFLYALEV